MRSASASSAARLGIGQLARRGDCTVDTIRYYERLGLMPRPERTEGGQRRYAESAARQLVFVRRLRDLGFSLNEIKQFLGLVRQPRYGCAEFKTVADARLAEIRRKIGELRRLAGRIAFLIEQCATAGDASCNILDALWEGAALEPGRQPAEFCCGGRTFTRPA